MIAFSDVEDFVRTANRITRPDELADLLQGGMRTLGFDHVALVRHVQRPPAEAVQYVDYPDAWKEVASERGYFADDPVMAACEVSAAAFLWSDLPRLLRLTARQREILDRAVACGLGEGFTVPVNVPGDTPGSCSFAVRAGRELPVRALPAAQYMGCFAFEAARRIRLMMETRARPANGAPPRLSGRQLDCLALAAQGKSDWAIAQLLGISSDTVHQHIETAKRRYGVATRTQLVVRALFDSQITFADALD